MLGGLIMLVLLAVMVAVGVEVGDWIKNQISRVIIRRRRTCQ